MTGLFRRAAGLADLQNALLDPLVKREGLTHASFQLLATVRAGGRISQAEAARILGLSAATVSEAAADLAAKGCLARERSDEDRRLQVLRVTPATDEVLDRIARDLKKIEERVLEGLDPAALRQACETLDRVIERMAEREL
ncbi:MAG: MarR family transcriptional regulator [Fimbriimonadaceae bacterium]|nr:MarR family transcriptional regulator [Fimbriimonadaceae bacterium]